LPNTGLWPPDSVEPSPLTISGLPGAPWQQLPQAVSAADFAVTYAILQNSGKELNPVTGVLNSSVAVLAVNLLQRLQV
jgi:hypothetical protein